MPTNQTRDRLVVLAPGIRARQPELATRLDSRGGILELGVQVSSFREAIVSRGTLSAERPVAVVDGARAFADALAAHPSFGDRVQLTLILPVLGAPGDAVPEMRDTAMTLLADGLQALALSDHLDDDYLDALWRTVLSPDEGSEALRAVLNHGRRLPEIDPRISLDELMRKATRLFQQGCGAAIRNDFKIIGAQIQASAALDEWALKNPIKVWPPTQSISSISPTVGCAGTQVSIKSATAAFGATKPDEVEVRFARRGGGCTVASVVGWSPGSVDAVAPNDVGVGPVGFINVPRPPDSLMSPGSLGDAIGTAQGDIDACLGAAGATFVGRLSKLNIPVKFSDVCPPSVNGGVNVFQGGRPIIKSFTIRTNGPPPSSSVDVHAGDSATLEWAVENATAVMIVPARDNGRLNQLPALPNNGTVSSTGSAPTGPIRGTWDWEGAYELRATNACASAADPETAQTHVRMIMQPIGGFLIGVATAGHQVEGDLQDDWAIFESSPAINAKVVKNAAIAGGTMKPGPAGPALRHRDLRALASDLDRASLLGCNAYRFSIEWSRVEPSPGNYDRTALNYYVEVVRMLRRRRMEPVVTLNHLTLPQWVLTPPVQQLANVITKIGGFDTGDQTDPGYVASLKGWSSLQTVSAFVEYVKFVVGQLHKEGVRYWITLNEPVGSMVGVGYFGGLWPPGFAGEFAMGKSVYFNLIIAHVQAARAIKAIDSSAQVSFAQNVAAAVKSQLKTTPGQSNIAARNQFDYFFTRHMLDAVTTGTVDMDINHKSPVLNVKDSDAFFGIPKSDWVSTLDFIGVNYYRLVRVYHDSTLASIGGSFVGGRFDDDQSSIPGAGAVRESNRLLTGLGWEVFPEGLHDVLVTLHSAYGLPLMITETGMSESSERYRSAHLTAHIEQMQKAQAEGVNVLGYLYWSLIDNFEWSFAYNAKARFGLYTVDRSTDPAGNLRLGRNLTDGGLGFRLWAHGASTADLIERFGTITPSGDTCTVPTKSPGALFRSISPGIGIDLYVSRAGNTIIAMLFDGVARCWVKLHDLDWQPGTRRLSAVHPMGAGFPERELDLVLNAAGDRFSGTITEVRVPATTPVTVELDKDWLDGVWTGGEPWTLLAISGVGRQESPTAPDDYSFRAQDNGLWGSGLRGVTTPNGLRVSTAGGAFVDFTLVVVAAATGSAAGLEWTGGYGFGGTSPVQAYGRLTDGVF